jgi:hypothetical protein
VNPTEERLWALVKAALADAGTLVTPHHRDVEAYWRARIREALRDA